MPTAAGVARGDTVWAMDPELQLLALDRRAARAESDLVNANTADTAVSLVGLLLSLAASDEDEPVEEGPNWFDEIEANEARYDSEMATIEYARFAWNELALRRTTLYPGEAVGGDLRFPAQYDQSYLRLVIPVGETLVFFDFEQVAR